MAFPVVESVAESSTPTAGTSHAITLPSGIAANDLILFVIDKGTPATTSLFDTHADYQELLDENTASGLAILYRYATGGESNPTLVTASAIRTATIAYRISGAINPATQVPEIGTTATGSSVSPNPPTVTPTGGAKDYLWIAFFGRAGEEADDDTWTSAAPSGFTNLLQKACGVAGTNLGGMVASAEQQLNASSLDPGTFTVATGAWRAQTIAVHPAPPPAANPPPQLVMARRR